MELLVAEFSEEDNNYGGKILCNDGFIFNCFASRKHLSYSNIDRYEEYTHVELNFDKITRKSKILYFFFKIPPFDGFEIIKDFLNNKRFFNYFKYSYLNRYGYVPVDKVRELIIKHGGFNSGFNLVTGIF